MKKLLFFLALELIFIFFLDKTLSDFIYNLYLKYKYIQAIVKLGNILGDPFIITRFTIFLFTFSLFLKLTLKAKIIFKNKQKYLEKFYKISLVIFLSFLLSNALVHLIKILTLRERPFFTDNPLNFFCYYEAIAKKLLWKTHYKSFPSGHVICSSSLFFSLYFIFKTLKKNIYQKLAFLFFFIPFLTALARIALKAHWPSDTFLSLLLGYYVSYYVFKKLNLRENS